jgi:hypothetical protein
MKRRHPRERSSLSPLVLVPVAEQLQLYLP